jgi:hypothetical protein
LLRCQRLSGFAGILGALVEVFLPAGGVVSECVIPQGDLLSGAVDGEKGVFFFGMVNS